MECISIHHRHQPFEKGTGKVKFFEELLPSTRGISTSIKRAVTRSESARRVMQPARNACQIEDYGSYTYIILQRQGSQALFQLCHLLRPAPERTPSDPLASSLCSVEQGLHEARVLGYRWVAVKLDLVQRTHLGNNPVEHLGTKLRVELLAHSEASEHLMRRIALDEDLQHPQRLGLAQVQARSHRPALRRPVPSRTQT